LRDFSSGLRGPAGGVFARGAVLYVIVCATYTVGIIVSRILLVFLYHASYSSPEGWSVLPSISLATVSVNSLFLTIVLTITCYRFPHLFQYILPSVKEYDDYDSFQKLLLNESKLSSTDSLISNKLRAIAEIDSRVDNLRRRSGFILLSIAALLIVASLVVVFAGTLTNLDASAASSVDRLTSEIADTQNKIAILSEAADLIDAIDKTPDNNKKSELKNRLDSLTARSGFAVPATSTAISTVTSNSTSHLESMRKLLDDAWTKELSTPKGYNDTPYMIASAITRVGVVLVIVFLVQILIGLFRYNSRLITFYNARRDLLQIWNGDLKDMDKLEDMFAPRVDFGKEPKHPIDEIIRQILAKLPTSPFGGSKEGLE
jgi:hypothetical protein